MPVYSISNTKIAITVNSFGAELISLKSNSTELFWQADKTVWPRHAPILFPIVGKLKENKFKYNNAEYNLSQHGFARDKEFALVEQSENVLEFELTASEETLEIYPFHFSLRIRYELSDATLAVKYLVFNPDKTDLLFSIGAHPGFNCKRLEGETLNDFYLEFKSNNHLTIEKLKDGLLSGETSIIKLDSGKLQLSTELFENDALVFKNTQIEEIKLCSTKSKQQIKLNCKNWPYFGIWSKKGSDAFVCLEPWYGITDSVGYNGNFDLKEGVIRLQPYQSSEYIFSVQIT
ncbi:MAG: aldose 1-epimerase family protein [Sphingobacteriaceae bacterium]|nr:aldose 1-epimerase family protein [Sphingobacteriaceae bacterium]